MEGRQIIISKLLAFGSFFILSIFMFSCSSQEMLCDDGKYFIHMFEAGGGRAVDSLKQGKQYDFGIGASFIYGNQIRNESSDFGEPTPCTPKDIRLYVSEPIIVGVDTILSGTDLLFSDFLNNDNLQINKLFDPYMSKWGFSLLIKPEVKFKKGTNVVSIELEKTDGSFDSDQWEFFVTDEAGW